MRLTLSAAEQIAHQRDVLSLCDGVSQRTAGQVSASAQRAGKRASVGKSLL